MAESPDPPEPNVQPVSPFGKVTERRLLEFEQDDQFKAREIFWAEFIGKHGAKTASRLMAMYERQTNVDTLTGLKSRDGFLQSGRELASFFEELSSADWQLTLIYGDADGLKQTNDTVEWGRRKGDQLLVKIGEAFQDSIDAGVVGRVGADEFALLVPVLSEGSQNKVLAKINAKLQDDRDKAEIPPWGGVSIGILALEKGQDLEEALIKVDAIMKDAKKAKIRQAGERGAHVNTFSIES